MWTINWGEVSAFGGLIFALLGLAGGYGQLRQKVNDMGARLDRLEHVVAKVAVIEERTGATRDDVRAISGKLDSITGFLLGEKRTWAPAPVTPASLPQA